MNALLPFCCIALQVKNPIVSSSQVTERLRDVGVVRLSDVRARRASTGLAGSWGTIGVIGEKSAPRVSANGKSYSIWKITDLESTCITLFMFGGAYQDWRGEAVGTLIALLTPKVFDGGW